MKILFMCVANSARSQMAEAMARKLFGKRVEVRSAGSEPAHRVHPMALQVLEEIGVETKNLVPKSLVEIEPAFIQNLDFVITLCAEEVCPTLPGDSQSLHWLTPDPAGASQKEVLENFRRARDFIAKKLQNFHTALIRSEQEEELR